MQIRFTGHHVKLLFLALLFTSCRVSYIPLRPQQRQAHDDDATVTRVYVDRYGDFYPDVAVPINPKYFIVDGRSTNRNLASLEHYFLNSQRRLKLLTDFYGVHGYSSDTAAYAEVQKRILKKQVSRIAETINRQQADKLVYLVHGINDLLAESEFEQMRDTVVKKNYKSARHPAFVFFHWDGLNAHATDSTPVFKIWQLALRSSRYASIALRRLINGVEQQSATPAVIITHSLGAGVALGALFNTTTKWKEINVITPEADKKQLEQLSLTPTPTGDIRIGILAPAIPGRRTFIDFNQREPQPFDNSKNHIQRVVIGFNRKDYAVTKENRELLDVNLSRLYGSTSLGCDDVDEGKHETEWVKDELLRLGYTNASKMVIPIEFQTPERINNKGIRLGTHEHAWRFYTGSAYMQSFLDSLFL